MISLVVSSLLLLFAIYPAHACLGPESEVAQESDAETIFIGRSTKLSFTKTDDGDAQAKIEFLTVKTILGKSRAKWTILMEGTDVPRSLAEFKKEFGSTTRVGIRDLEAPLPKVVTSACNQNGDSWLLERVAER